MQRFVYDNSLQKYEYIYTLLLYCINQILLSGLLDAHRM